MAQGILVDYQLTQQLNELLDGYRIEFSRGRTTRDLIPKITDVLKKKFNTQLTEDLKIDWYDNKLLIRSLSDNLDKWCEARGYQQTKEITDFNFTKPTQDASDRFFENMKLKYNENWLNTELKTTKANINSINNWETYPSDSYLKYVTAFDGHVRDEHFALEGLIMKKTDPRWSYCYPPIPANPYNCRCRVVPVYDVIPSTDVATRVEQMSKATKISVEDIKASQHPIFSGKMFDEKTSHFKGTPQWVYKKI